MPFLQKGSSIQKTCRDCVSVGYSATNESDPRADECYFAMDLLDGGATKPSADEACKSYGATLATFDTKTPWSALQVPLTRLSGWTGHVCSSTKDCTKTASWGDPRVDWRVNHPTSSPQGTLYCGFAYYEPSPDALTFVSLPCAGQGYAYAVCEQKSANRAY